MGIVHFFSVVTGLIAQVIHILFFVTLCNRLNIAENEGPEQRILKWSGYSLLYST